MAKLLTTATSLMCPHGGQVQAVSGNIRSKAVGSAILRSSDTFTITGCTFSIPGVGFHPCVTVRWIKSNVRSKAGDYMLASDSIGMCLAGDQAPQGVVIVSSTQAKGSGL